MYQLQFHTAEDRWQVIDAGGDLSYLSRRRQAFLAHTGIEPSRVRILDVAPPRTISWAQQEASGLLTFVTAGLVILLVAVVALAFG